MHPTDFAYYLTNFLSKYLPGERGASPNTIASYRDTFALFLAYMNKVQHYSASVLNLKDISKDTIEDFLKWLETNRNNSISTRNNRLAAIHAFFQFLQYENPDNLHEWQRILSIPMKHKEKPTITYLSLDGVKLLLSLPEQTTRQGRRDLALLALMYDTAARVQEVIDLTPAQIRFDNPCTVQLVGKGKKARIVPMLNSQMELLKQYMEEHRLLVPARRCYPLFSNSRGEKLTRAGVNYILEKYIQKARQENACLIPDKFSCHCLRHSKSMHLLQAGVNLVYIRDILGHESIQTTEIYARADSKQKREAIERAYVDLRPESEDEPKWQENPDLLAWLKGLNH